MNSTEEFTVARVIARLNVGGPAIQAILMTEAFRRKGYRSLLLTGDVPPGETSMEYLADARGVKPIKIRRMSRRLSLWQDLSALWTLIRIFRRENPTVVHTHTAKAGAIGRLAAMVTGVPIVVHTFHGHVFCGYFSPLRTRIFLAIERFLAKRTDCIVAISDSQRRELMEVYKVAPADKVVTIPLGVDLDPFLRVNGHGGVLRSELGISKAQPVVGWVGRLTAIKSPLSMIECAALLREHSLAPHFVMIGDGELRLECEKRIYQGSLQNTVTMAGWRRDLAGLYADVNLVVATSQSEGTPVALLEAMASGKAVVSTDVGGVRDLMVGSGRTLDGLEVFENGILVDCNVKKLARAIEYLIQDPSLCRSMGHKGREFVARRFSHIRLANDLGELYHSLAKTKLFPLASFVSREVG